MMNVRTAPCAAVEKRGCRAAKRALDIVLSLLLGILSLIPMGILAAVIVCKDGGSPFYAQSRVGQNGQEFKLIKLRSMKKGSDRPEDILDERQMREYQKEYKLDDDPRLIGWKKPGDGSCCFGARLRRSSLDELPQILFNVLLTGKMSMVGPRPILRQELEENYTREEQELLLSVKPGLTGYWQVSARNNASYGAGERQKMELSYARNANLLWDIQILFQTFKAVIKKQGAK